jgi:(1->4)-alpha-D-glucan 1-alpha-D-glucosylmutase
MNDMTMGPELPQRVRALLDNLDDGRAKLYVTWRCLELRRQCASHFQHGEYLPLTVRGAYADCLCAHAWRLENELIIAAAPRHFLTLMEDSVQPPLGITAWRETLLELPTENLPAHYVNLFTAEHLAISVSQAPSGPVVTLRAAELFANFPVALLRSELVKTEERPL